MEFEILLKSILRHCDIAFTELKKASYFIFENMKPSAQPSAKKLLPPKQKQKEKKLLPSAEASAFGPPLLDSDVLQKPTIAHQRA